MVEHQIKKSEKELEKAYQELEKGRIFLIFRLLILPSKIFTSEGRVKEQ